MDCHVCRDDCLAQRHGDVVGGGVQGPTAARRRVIAQHRALHWLAADLAHPRNRTVAPRHHRNTYLGEAAFNDWGWRVPVLVLFPADVHRLLYPGAFSGIADIRGDQGQGGNDQESWKEAFLSVNIKFVLIATVIALGEGVVWYSGQFWALHFLQQVTRWTR